MEIPAGGANGVILAQGGRFGGWSLYVKDGKPAYTYNFVGLQQYTVNATERLAPGKATIKLEFAYDGNGRGKGGTTTIYVNGKKVGSGRVEHTNAEHLLGRRRRRRGRGRRDQRELGVRNGAENRFTGKIEKVLVEVPAEVRWRLQAVVSSEPIHE